MSDEPAAERRISLAARIGYGILLPVAAFIVCQLVLIGTTSGTGSWDGMSLFFGTIFIVPGLLIVNLWVVIESWARRSSAFIAGMMIPAVIAVAEYLWLYGHAFGIRAAINRAFIAPFPWIWLFVLLLFAPLVVSIVRAVIRRSRRRR